MIDTLTITPATAEDIPALHTLIETAYRGAAARAGWTHEADLLGGQRTDPAMLGAMIADPAEFLLIARVDDVTIGCVALRDLGDDAAYLGLLTVDPVRQATGLGRRLLTAAETLAVEQGAAQVEMTVIALRSDLIAWYERRGYRLTGERRPFPHGDSRFGLPKRGDLDFVVLARNLGGL